ncbi:MAG: DUF1294 domain-containing protein [Phocaeicola sp.]|uniref:DUF1294 domain-containing protein n=1 Tax=Phocaeicola sp. TaxID=2773926 RepID=UPI003FA0EB57
MIQFAIIYLIIINLITFAIYGIDKWKARYHRWRVSEATLILLAVIGGALGASIGMEIFRHKTQHWKFKILVPLLLVFWIVIIGYLAWQML